MILEELDEAEALFDQLSLQDPYALDFMDVYSNVLYVKENASKLSMLAQQCNAIDPYRSETCAVIGKNRVDPTKQSLITHSS